MVTCTETWKRTSMATATDTHMKISTMATAMAMATLMRASGMGMAMDIHGRMCTMAIAMATPTIASTTEDMDIAMEPLGRLGLQASSTTWTLSPSGPMHWGPQC